CQTSLAFCPGVILSGPSKVPIDGIFAVTAGAAAAATFTVSVLGWDCPPGPLAISMYFVVAPGLTDFDPLAPEMVSPSSEISMAFCASHFRVVDCPAWRFNESAAKEAMAGTGLGIALRFRATFTRSPALATTFFEAFSYPSRL